MSETSPHTVQASRPRRSFWRRWGWRILLSILIVSAVAGYYMYRRGQVAGFVLFPDTGKNGPFRLIVHLPGLGSLESFRQDQAPARAICRKLGLPELPDISDIDPDGQKQFYNMFLMLRAEPRNHDKYGLLGQLYEAQKIPQLAVPLYRRAIEMAPYDYEWHYALGLRLAKDAEYEKAKAEFERAAELKPDYAPVWMQLAWRASERKDGQAALSCLDRYIALRPEDPFGYVERAEAHFAARDWKLMEQDLEKALLLKQQKKGYIGKKGHRLLGGLYGHLGRDEDSRVHLLLSVEDQPGEEMDDPIGIMVSRLETFRNPLTTKFEGLVFAKRYHEALAMKNDLLAEYEDRKDEPMYGLICGKISECYRQLGDYSNALIYAREACQALPGQPQPYTSLALLSLTRGKLEDAIEDAEKALRIDPDYHVALYVIALARIELAIRQMNLPAGLRRPEPESLVALAAEDLEKALAQKPVNSAYLVTLANAHGMLGQYDRANELIETALRVDPQDRKARLLKEKAEARANFWPSAPNR